MLQDMDWCQEYAWHNRRLMMDLLAEAVEHVTGCSPDMTASVNIHHNYCQCEECSWQACRACLLLPAQSDPLQAPLWPAVRMCCTGRPARQ